MPGMETVSRTTFDVRGLRIPLDQDEGLTLTVQIWPHDWLEWIALVQQAIRLHVEHGVELWCYKKAEPVVMIGSLCSNHCSLFLGGDDGWPEPPEIAQELALRLAQLTTVKATG
jgi:hypothetical protein